MATVKRRKNFQKVNNIRNLMSLMKSFYKLTKLITYFI